MTEPLPPSPLFPPYSVVANDAMTLRPEIAPKRRAWPVVLAAVMGTMVVALLVGGAYLTYHAKANEISRLKGERHDLRAKNAVLESRLAITNADLQETSQKLAKATHAYTLTKQNLTKMRKDLAAANERAIANYDAGYSAGSSNGYSSGRDAGLVAGSDQLACSDDPDVTWLPYCN